MNAIVETPLSTRIHELAAASLQTSVNEIAISKVTGDASTRAYFRATAATGSVIIALYSAPFDERLSASDRLAAAEAHSPAARLTFANDPCAHIETTAIFLQAGLPVPRLLAASGEDCVLLLEDLGDTRLQDWLEGRSADETRETYRRAVAMIVKLQEATKLATVAHSICSRLAFDEAKLKWELGFFFANYINKYLGLKLDPTTANAINQDFKALCAELAARPRVLTHRDYHTRNLMMKDGEIYIIDQQDARLGPTSYDVASLLSDPYAALEANTAADLIEHFIELKAASRVPLESVDEFRRELHLMRVQRMLKAIGTYAYQAAVMNNRIYVDYIKPATHSAIASMQALDCFASTRDLIEQAIG
ncbi:MAG: phosphotransferase [Acidobacteria bacterium]|nr:phosphotransferase [Acidobacteriota bacterium]